MLLERSSLSSPLREKILTSTTIPSTPGGTVSEVSFTSPAFSPKMARSNFSSGVRDRKSTRLNSSHGYISYAVFCLKKKNKKEQWKSRAIRRDALETSHDPPVKR